MIGISYLSLIHLSTVDSHIGLIGLAFLAGQNLLLKSSIAFWLSSFRASSDCYCWRIHCCCLETFSNALIVALIEFSYVLVWGISQSIYRNSIGNVCWSLELRVLLTNNHSLLLQLLLGLLFQPYSLMRKSIFNVSVFNNGHRPVLHRTGLHSHGC